MRKLVPLIAASALSVAVIVGVAGAVPAPPNTQIHGVVTHKRTQTFHIYSTQSGTARCRLDRRAWFTCGIGNQTFRNLKPGLHTVRAKAVNSSGQVDPTPAKRTWRVN